MENKNKTRRKLQFTWIINNFFDCSTSAIYRKLVSPAFTPDPSASTKWYGQLDYTKEKDLLKWSLCKEKDCLLYKDDFLEVDFIDKAGNVICSKSYKKKGPASESVGGIAIKTLIARWHISSNIQDNISTTDQVCVAKTTYNVNKCSFEWKVKFQDEIQKRLFWIGDKKLEISLYVHGIERDFLVDIRGNLGTIFRFLKGTLSLLDNDGIKKASKTEIFGVNAGIKHIKFPSFFKKDMLLSEDNRFLDNGVFTLNCEFFIFDGSYSSEIEYKSTKQEEMTPVTQDLKRIYDEKLFPNVQFRIGDDMLFAHKCVLSVHSPVFLAMFSQDMAEKQTGVVDIVDSDSKTFDAFLKYFYYGTVHNMDWELAIKLIKLADKYQVTRLVSLCSSVLASDLTLENAIEILVAADATQNSNLKEMAIRFIKEHAADVLSGDAWKEFIKNNNDLVAEIITFKQ